MNTKYQWQLKPLVVCICLALYGIPIPLVLRPH